MKMATKYNIVQVTRNIEHINTVSRRLIATGNGHGKFKFNFKAGILQQASVSQAVFQSNKMLTRQQNTSAVVNSPFTKHDSDLIEKRVKENIKSIQDGMYEKEVSHPEDLKHFKKGGEVRQMSAPVTPPESTGEPRSPPPIGTHCLPHPIWSEEELMSVKETHKKPEGIVDRMALYSVKLLRRSFDWLSGFNKGERGEKIWINRIIFLETVAGVPGMVAAMVRHLHSLRRLRRDHGWIHTLLEEAENERMHLMTALQLKQPSWLFRMGVVCTQGMFVMGFSLAYLASPRFCHRMVGYLEEEAVHTYSKLLRDMESGGMKHWNTQKAPDLAIRYWHLAPDATMKDVVLAIRADEAHHRVVNHTLSSMKSTDYNPYKPGE